MEELFESWESPASQPDLEAELKKLRRSLRRRNGKIIAISLILAAAILIGTVHYGIPALERLYWNPEANSYGTAHATDLHMTLYAYTNLFNNDRRVDDITAVRTGFATYSLSLEARSKATLARSFSYATLEKGKLTIQEGLWDDYSPVNVGNKRNATSEDHLALLSQLPDYIRVGCYVTFCSDITMEEALELGHTLGRDAAHTSNYTDIQWLAIRHQDNAYARPCGLTLGGYYGLFDEINAYYPYFCGIDLNMVGTVPDESHLSEAEREELRFKSLLRYLHDQQQKGQGIEVPNYPNYYADALQYVEENGVNVYGCYITASANTLLQINEMENVKYLFPVDAWINI